MDEMNNQVPEEEACTHDCSTCHANCASKEKKSLIEEPHPMSTIRKVIGVVSGKGGVGKSLVTSILATKLRALGNETAVLDADITGPSIPKIFGVSGDVTGTDDGIFPLESRAGVKVMSVNLLLEDETSPVVWRGPVIAGTVKQFWTDVIWGDVDVMFVDCPPGTGDVPLTVFQSIPLDGVIIVTSPQDLVSMIVAKAVNMAKMMNIPVLGIVENMSFIRCPDCGKEISVFGKSKADEVAAEFGLPLLGRMPIDPSFAALCDAGKIDECVCPELDPAAAAIEALLK